MHDPRNSSALRQLADLGRDPLPARWDWSIARPDPQRRLRLAAEARSALGFWPGRRTEVRGICHRVALVVRTDGEGAPIVVDGRGHLTLPVWLRRPTGLMVGADVGAALLVIAPVSALDGLGDLLAGVSR